MTPVNPTEVIAEALDLHRYNIGGSCNGCDWVATDESAAGFREQHRAHQASVIAALPDIAIVALPKPDPLGNWKVYGTDLRVRNTWHEEACIELDMESIRAPARLTKTYEISVAPDLAATLLAAARATGGES